MRIAEPITMLTDYVLGIACLGFAARLRGEATRGHQRSVRAAAAAFLGTGLAALIGGTSHGFALMIDPTTKRVLWKLAVFGVGTASFFLLSAMLRACAPPGPARVLAGLNLLKLVVYVAWMTGHDDYRYVVYDYGASLIVVLGFAAVSLGREKQEGPAWLIAGIVLSMLGAAVQQSGFALHSQFNHNDLYHVIQIAAMALLYQGARRLSDWPS